MTKLDGNQSFSEPYGHLHITAPCIPVEEAVTPSEKWSFYLKISLHNDGIAAARQDTTVDKQK